MHCFLSSQFAMMLSSEVSAPALTRISQFPGLLFLISAFCQSSQDLKICIKWQKHFCIWSEIKRVLCYSLKNFSFPCLICFSLMIFFTCYSHWPWPMWHLCFITFQLSSDNYSLLRQLLLTLLLTSVFIPLNSQTIKVIFSSFTIAAFSVNNHQYFKLLSLAWCF